MGFPKLGLPFWETTIWSLKEPSIIPTLGPNNGETNGKSQGQ